MHLFRCDIDLRLESSARTTPGEGDWRLPTYLLTLGATSPPGGWGGGVGLWSLVSGHVLVPPKTYPAIRGNLWRKQVDSLAPVIPHFPLFP